MPNWDKRTSNRESSAEILKENGIDFVSHNGGAHLVVNGSIDFWPGTGKFMVRTNGGKGRGVFN